MLAWAHAPVTLVGVTDVATRAPGTGPEPDPAGGAGEQGGAGARRRGAWRWGTPVALLLSGALFTISYANSDGTDLRPGRYTDLAALVEAESDSYDALRAEVDDLDAEIEQLSAGIAGTRVQKLRREVARLEPSAGLTPVSGEGITVSLADGPSENVDAAEAAGYSLNRLVVHQQDIQAVVNAMWLGGAEAVTLQGQRIVSTTGIRCEGNAVTLQGIPYAQPFVISAVGDPDRLQAALEGDADVQAYRDDADNPLLGIGFDLETEDEVEAPAFEGLLDLGYARPLTS